MRPPASTAPSTSSDTLVTASSLTSGPTWVSSAMPGPTRIADIRSASRRENSSATSACTKKRLAAVQASPPLRILATIAPSRAASRSASSKTRNGALPPSSIEQLTTWSAASFSRIRPTSVDPVNDSLRTRASCSIAETTAPERRAGTTLTTPAGTPASSRILPISRAVSGVSDAGLSTTGQPAARAGPILRVAIAAGKFQGVTSTAIPTGWRTTMIRFAPDGAVVSSPEARTASSAYHRKNSAAYATSPRASTSALPFSSDIRWASSSARAVISSKARRRTSARSRGAVAAQPAAAASAASTAARASSTVPSATAVSASPVAGSTTSKRPPSEAGTALPPISRSSGRSVIWSRVKSPMSRVLSVGVGDEQVLGGEEGEHLRAVVGEHDLLLDPRGGVAVGRGAVGLEGEHHPGPELDGLLHRVQARDDRPLVQAEPEPVGELQPERLHLAAEAELLGLRQQRGDLVGAHADADTRDPAVHPLPGLGVGVALGRGRAADREGAVVAGPVAVEGVDDVEERLVAWPDQPVGEVVRVRVAPLAGDGVDRLDLVRPHLVEALVGEGDDLVLADAGLQPLDDPLVDPVDHRDGLGQQHDLVGRLDDARVQHVLLGVDDGESLPLHLEEERRLDEVDPHRLVGHAGLGQQGLDLGDGRLHQPHRRRDRTTEAEEAGAVVLLRHPLRVDLVVLDRRAEVPQHRVAVAGQQCVADHLVAEGAADPRVRRVADVVEVEEQERPALARVQCRLRRAEPVVAQPREVDPPLVVDPHVPGSRERSGHDVPPPDRPSSTSTSSGLSSRPALWASRSSRIAKSSSTRPLLTVAWTGTVAPAAPGSRTSRPWAAMKARSKSLRSSSGVNVGE